jgi:hypothetical protein
VLHHAEQNSFVFLFVEVFPRHQALISLFGEFGFFDLGANTDRGELRLGKKLAFTNEELSTLDPLEFNKRFGPSAVKWTNTPGFVIPIKPKYHDMVLDILLQNRIIAAAPQSITKISLSARRWMQTYLQ